MFFCPSTPSWGISGPLPFSQGLPPTGYFVLSFPTVSLIFLKRSLVFPIQLFSSISFHGSLGRLFLSLLLFGTLHSNGCIFPVLLCLLCLFFSQQFVRPLQPFCLFAFLFLGDGLAPCLLYDVTNLIP